MPSNGVMNGASVVEVSHVELRVDELFRCRDDVVEFGKCECIVLLLKECGRAKKGSG